RDGEKLLATRELTLGPDGATVSTELTFDLPDAGPRVLRFQVAPLPGETNGRNNEISRLVNVEAGPRRILYVEGEPRWEYKFIRRAEEDDAAVQLVSMLRTSENKIYRQGVKDPLELAQGFPGTAADLFGYDGLVIGSVDAGYFSAAQQVLMREFVDRRGGGLLLLGGRQSLADGVWSGSALNDLLPVTLPITTGTFHREPATVSLTTAGADSAVTRLADDRAANLALWARLPYLMDYQDPGTAKPGASELAQMHAGGRSLPLLVTENYGRGRTAVLATGGTWRWQMSLPLGDPTHSVFWHQLLHWLVSDTHGQLSAQVSASTLQDDGHVQLQADVRDRNYLPAADAIVNAHVIGPDRLQADVSLRAVPGQAGRYVADWTAPAAGVYVADIAASEGALSAGRDTIGFQRQDGVAENFHTGQNVALLKSLAADTGGRYWVPDELDGLARAIPFSDAGVSVQRFRDLWNMPAVFVLLMLLRLTEWLLRRRWGVV
ncbi:MAG TPA: glutamine amidotransferase, partial [Steroidobacteraceae bacterium]|nr:glutamine amidotransferase [Steroidobacteraceae bacterium]